MSADGVAVLIAGLLHLAGTAAGILSVASSIEADDYLERAARDAHRVRAAAIAQAVMAIACGAVPLVLYPLLRRHSEALSLGFLSVQLAAAALVLLGATVLLGLLDLVQQGARRWRSSRALRGGRRLPEGHSRQREPRRYGGAARRRRPAV